MNKVHLLLFFILVMLQGNVVFGQDLPDATLETQNLSPLIGEPFRLSVRVEAPIGYTVQFDDVPVVGEDWEDFSVLAIGEPTQENFDNRQIHVLPIDAVVWRWGEVVTPNVSVLVVSSDATDSQRIVANPVYLTVPTTLDEEPQLRVRRIVIMWRALPRWAWALFVVSLFGLGLLMLRGIYRQWQVGQLQTELEDKLREGIGERTLQTLKRLPVDAPHQEAQIAAMGDSLRLYVIERFAGHEDMTNYELAIYLAKTKKIPAKRLQELRYLLSQSELAKFAPQQSASLNPAMIELAIRWVEQVEKDVTNSMGEAG